MKKRTKTSAVVLAGMLGVTTIFPSGDMMHPSCVKQVAHAASSSIDASDSGKCGDGVSYVFANGVLTISGNGTIEEKAFEEITKITSVVITDGVTGIGDAAFSGCTELSSITIPNTVTTIGSYAFANTKLTELTLPENLTTLGAFILKENTGVKNLTIPKTVETMQANKGGYHGSLYGSAVEEVIFADGIETIPERACQGMVNLTKVTLPESVTTLEDVCFSECTALTEITLPAKLNKIGSEAFQSTALKELNLPETITEMGAFILNKNTTVKNLTIPKTVTTMQANDGGYHGSLFGSAVENVVFAEGIETIPERACQGAKSLKNVTLPNTVKKIENMAFEFTALTELNLPENVTEMGAFILNENTTVKKISIPKTIKIMQANKGGYHGSLYGSAVEEIVFAEGIESIPERACQGMGNLTKVTLPESVTTLEDVCFSECTALTEITLPAKLNKIGSEAFQSTALKELNLPETITEMGAFILNENTTVKSLTIPKTIKIMQANEGGYHGSLYGSAVETVLFVDGLENLPDRALQGAKSLTKATIPVSVISVGKDAMEECENVKIYCYSGSYIDEYALQNNIAYEYIGEAKDSVITAPDYNLTSASSKQTFQIDTQVDGLGTLTYLSDKAAVTVDTEGNVTIAPDFVGTATITIKVSSVGEYKADSKNITVTVKPVATKISKLKNAKKNKMIVKWAKKSKVSGYQIQYSTNSKFKKNVKNVAISNSTVSSQTIKSLKNKKTYYVRIRTYKTVSGVTYYSDWSTIKKVKITK